MNIAILPAACLCAAFGLTVSLVARRVLWPALMLAAVVAGVVSIFQLGLVMDSLFLATWICTAGVAAAIHLPRPPGVPVVFLVAGVVGFLAGAGVSFDGSAIKLTVTLPWLLLGAALTTGLPQYPIISKVLASWLIAIAILSAGIPFAGTPGYAPDHME